jgi:small subunit ribosomal protein S13
VDRLHKFFKNDFGIKTYSYNFLKYNRGYNGRKPFNFIKESSIIQLEDRLMKLIDKQENIQKTQNIQNLKDMVSYRGMRHIKNLPTRGQRTKTNSKTSKKRSKEKKTQY